VAAEVGHIPEQYLLLYDVHDLQREPAGEGATAEGRAVLPCLQAFGNPRMPEDSAQRIAGAIGQRQQVRLDTVMLEAKYSLFFL
jgi:hypothetical protein